MTTRFVLFAGTKSTAPCTVAKSPVPSAATVSASLPAAGPLVLVEKFQTVFSAKPTKGAPAASLMTPGSIVT